MSIVCGTDLSPNAAAGVRAAAVVCKMLGDHQLVIVQAREHSPTSAEVSAQHTAELRAHVEASGAALEGLTWDCQVAYGPAVATLTAAAKSHKASLLVVTSQGYSNSAQYRLGGTTERLVVTSPLPVLVIRDDAPWLRWAGGGPLRTTIAIDESAAAYSAWTTSMRWRQAPRCEASLGHVYYPDQAAARFGIKLESFVDANPALEAHLAKSLTHYLGAEPGIPLHMRPGLGRVGDQLLQLTEANQSDLVVIGVEASTLLGRLTSTAHVLLHDAKLSILCAPDVNAVQRAASSTMQIVLRPQTLENIVVATDGSEVGNRAIACAAALAAPLRAELHIVRVVPPHDAAASEEATRQLHKAAARYNAPSAKIAALAGTDVADTVLEFSERVCGDMLVLGSHHRSGLSRVLLGSTTDRIIKRSKTPVVLVPNRD